MIYEAGDLPTVESGIQRITETDSDTRHYVNVALIVSSTGKVFRREISNITLTFTCLSASYLSFESRLIGLSHARPNSGISGDLLSENEAKPVVI